MKIALLGYGKMGKVIEEVALEKKHELVLKINSRSALTPQELKQADVAIEFSTPASVLSNIYKCLDAGIPVIVGTTGWYESLEKVKNDCLAQKGAVLWASNFSIGVNIFFEINKKLAQLMNAQPQYEAGIEEIHHLQKLDAPSGTALSLAGQIIDRLERKKKWINQFKTENKEQPTPNDLLILSRREKEVAGIHTIKYTSGVDELEIKHVAHSRRGFAEGAVKAAEWISGKRGFFTMSDLLNY